MHSGAVCSITQHTTCMWRHAAGMAHALLPAVANSKLGLDPHGLEMHDSFTLSTTLPADDHGEQGLLTPGRPASDKQLLRRQLEEQQRYDEQQDNQLLLVDLVSFDHCQEVTEADLLVFLQHLQQHEAAVARFQSLSVHCAGHAPYMHSCGQGTVAKPTGLQTNCSVLCPSLQLVQVPPAVEQQVLVQFDVGAWSQPLPSYARQHADQLQRLPQENVGLWVPPHPRINNSSLYKLEQRLAKGRTLDARRIVRALQNHIPDSQQPGKPGSLTPRSVTVRAQSWCSTTCSSAYGYGHMLGLQLRPVLANVSSGSHVLGVARTCGRQRPTAAADAGAQSGLALVQYMVNCPCFVLACMHFAPCNSS